MSSKALVYCAGGGIGDSLMASLVARALHQRFDTVRALTLGAHREALERVPDFDDVLVDEGGDEKDLAQALQRESYEAAVVTWATARTARVPKMAKIPVRVGQARRMYSWQFTNRVTVRSELGDVTSHWSQILLDYARALDCDERSAIPKFEPNETDRAEALAALRDLDVDGEAYSIVHTTNAIAPVRGIWPVEGWSALVRAIRERFGAPVLLSGSAADSAIIQRIADQSGGISLAGKISIGAFGALAQSALHFAGITTGSMHVAAAVGCPTVGIFPFQTDVPERWAPLGPRTAVVRASYPCPIGERKETCPDYACIANLDVPRILAACEAVLAANPPAP